MSELSRTEQELGAAVEPSEVVLEAKYGDPAAAVTIAKQLWSREQGVFAATHSPWRCTWPASTGKPCATPTDHCGWARNHRPCSSIATRSGAAKVIHGAMVGLAIRSELLSWQQVRQGHVGVDEPVAVHPHLAADQLLHRFDFVPAVDVHASDDDIAIEPERVEGVRFEITTDERACA